MLVRQPQQEFAFLRRTQSEPEFHVQHSKKTENCNVAWLALFCGKCNDDSRGGVGGAKCDQI